MSATAAALYNVPAPGSQPPAPGRAGFTTFKADSHFAAEMGSRRARQLQPVGGDGAPVADMLVDELGIYGRRQSTSGTRQRSPRRGGTLAGGARGGGWRERSGCPGNALRWLP